MQNLNFNNIKPFLSQEAEIHKVNDDEYILYHSHLKHQIRINSISQNLLTKINGKKNIDTIAKEISGSLNIAIDSNYIYDFLYNKLYKYGFIDNNLNAQKRKTSNYLAIRFTLIPVKIVNFIGKSFTFLFNSFLAFIITFSILFIIVAINIAYFFSTHAYQDIVFNEQTFLLLFVLGFIICIFHEIGHASSLIYFKRKAGDIGVGFYLFYPVFYCDVSESWFLKKKQRVVVSLAGVYFELVLAFLFSVLSFFTENILFILLSSSVLMRMVVNLNPFSRYDGYWILSDITNKPNLQIDSLKHVGEIVKNFLKKQIYPVKFNPFLFFFGLCSYSFIALFLLFVILFNASSLIYFPLNAYDIFMGIAQKGVVLKNIPTIASEVGLPILFYYLVIKMVFKYIKSKGKF
jgi:putative peptide zinc metalloprotease protein